VHQHVGLRHLHVCVVGQARRKKRGGVEGRNMPWNWARPGEGVKSRAEERVG
jgi:hypothetical protein